MAGSPKRIVGGIVPQMNDALAWSFEMQAERLAYMGLAGHGRELIGR